MSLLIIEQVLLNVKEKYIVLLGLEATNPQQIYIDQHLRFFFMSLMQHSLVPLSRSTQLSAEAKEN